MESSLFHVDGSNVGPNVGRKSTRLKAYMKFSPAFYGAEAQVLGMMHRRRIIYLSILKTIAKGMGGRVPDEYREMVLRHAADAADMVIDDEASYRARQDQPS